MRRILLVTFIACVPGLGSAANAIQAATSATHLESGSILYAELSKSVDAKKAKVGDPVTAVLAADVLAHGKIAVRHDSKLVGHIIEIQVHSKETPESRLGIVFDKIVTKDGEISLQSLLLAVRPAEHAVNVPSLLPNSPQGSSKVHASPMGSNIPHRIHDSADENPLDRKGGREGPTDIDGLSLSSSANGGAPTIVSTQRTVKLESGIRLELRVTGQ